MHVCVRAHMWGEYFDTHVHIVAGIRCYSSGVFHLAFETGSLTGQELA